MLPCTCLAQHRVWTHPPLHQPAAMLTSPSPLAAAPPPCHAELLLHVRPDRLREMQQVLHGLDAAMQQYAQVSCQTTAHLNALDLQQAQKRRAGARSCLHEAFIVAAPMVSCNFSNAASPRMMHPSPPTAACTIPTYVLPARYLHASTHTSHPRRNTARCCTCTSWPPGPASAGWGAASSCCTTWSAWRMRVRFILWMVREAAAAATAAMADAEGRRVFHTHSCAPHREAGWNIASSCWRQPLNCQHSLNLQHIISAVPVQRGAACTWKPPAPTTAASTCATDSSKQLVPAGRQWLAGVVHPAAACVQQASQLCPSHMLACHLC